MRNRSFGFTSTTDEVLRGSRGDLGIGGRYCEDCHTIVTMQRR